MTSNELYTDLAPDSIDPGQILVSRFHPPRTKTPVIFQSAITLRDVAELVRSDLSLRTNTLFVRPLKATDEAEYQRQKRRMSCIIPASSAGEGEALKKLPIAFHNRLYGYDLDRGDFDAPALVEALKHTPGCAMVARSVGGDLWCIFAGPAATGLQNYETCWTAISEGFPETVRSANGAESKNFNRGRILAHDPEVWLAESVVPVQVEVPDEPEKPETGKATAAKQKRTNLLGLLEVPQERNQWLFRLMLLKAADYDVEQVEAWSAGGEKYVQGEVAKEWASLEPEETQDVALAKLGRIATADIEKAGGYVLRDPEVLDDLAVVRRAMADRGAERDGEGAPKLFTTGGGVARLAKGGTLRLEHLSLLDELGAQAQWYRAGERDELTKGTPCADALKIAVSADSERAGLPELNTIVYQPIVLPNGNDGYAVVDTPGYRERAGVLSRVRGIDPSMDLETAKAWLNDAFGIFETGENRPKEKTGFRFTDGQAASNAVACLFSPMLIHADRRIIAPMFAATKLETETGGTTFLQAVARLSTGKKLNGITWGKNVEELEKAIGALWSRGISTIFFDNVLEAAESSLVSTLITEGGGGTRKLGSSAMLYSPGPPLLMMSANKTGLGDDYSKRICQIDFDWGGPKSSDEDLDKAFRHHPFESWLDERMGTAQSAMCVILRCALEKLPSVGPGKSRFPVWERWVNAVLDSLGMPHTKVGILTENLETPGKVRDDLLYMLCKRAQQLGRVEAFTRDELVQTFCDAGYDPAKLPGVRGMTIRSACSQPGRILSGRRIRAAVRQLAGEDSQRAKRCRLRGRTLGANGELRHREEPEVLD